VNFEIGANVGSFLDPLNRVGIAKKKSVQRVDQKFFISFLFKITLSIVVSPLIVVKLTTNTSEF
jgi:hypothetical protein